MFPVGKDGGMNRWVASAAVGAGAFVLLAGAAAGGYTLHHPGTRTVTVTHTVTRTSPPKVVTRTVTHAIPGPTVTVTASGDTAQLQTDSTCIAVLYQNIQFWKANGSLVPNGWWIADARSPSRDVSLCKGSA
jgi:hypothetical protein